MTEGGENPPPLTIFTIMEKEKGGKIFLYKNQRKKKLRRLANFNLSAIRAKVKDRMEEGGKKKKPTKPQKKGGKTEPAMSHQCPRSKVTKGKKEGGKAIFRHKHQQPPPRQMFNTRKRE